MSADILAFPERCEDTERKALIVKARADYDSIFPADTTTSVLGTKAHRGMPDIVEASSGDLINVVGQASQEVVASLNFMPASAATAITAQERNRLRLNSIHRRDNFKFRNSGGVRDIADDLIMDHVDNGMPSDAPYHAPESDPA